MNYYDEKFYLIGDDATHILILDKEYHKVDVFQLFTHTEKRIPKSIKADFEASTCIRIRELDHLLVLGSASREERKRITLISFPDIHSSDYRFKEYSIRSLVNRLMSLGIDQINFEGLTGIEQQLVLTNRGNLSFPKNHLIVTSNSFWEDQDDSSISILQLSVPTHVDGFIGVSEVCYHKPTNILFLTLSSEGTANTYEDGAIGDSYIGWIHGITQKMAATEIELNGLLNLSDVSTEFAGEKIEGLCVESEMNGQYILHLVSDNDQGESKLFKVRLDF